MTREGRGASNRGKQGISTSSVLTFQAVLWRYKFSQLKGSSDDGKSKIKFLFQNQDSKSIEAKVAHLG